MSVDAFGYILLGLTLFLTYMSFKTRSLPLSIIVAGLWIASWRYLQDNATMDASVLQIITIVSIAMSLLSLFMGFNSRGLAGESGETKYDKWGKFINTDEDNSESRRYGTRSMGRQSAAEYKEMIHTALHKRAK